MDGDKDTISTTLEDARKARDSLLTPWEGKRIFGIANRDYETYALGSGPDPEIEADIARTGAMVGVAA